MSQPLIVRAVAFNISCKYINVIYTLRYGSDMVTVYFRSCFTESIFKHTKKFHKMRLDTRYSVLEIIRNDYCFFVFNFVFTILTNKFSVLSEKHCNKIFDEQFM